MSQTAPVVATAQVVGQQPPVAAAPTVVSTSDPPPPAYTPTAQVVGAAPAASVVSTATVVSTLPPQQVQAVAVVPAPAPMVITCPPNVGPGQALEVTNPQTGQRMQVTVPPGVGPGQQFQVQFPPPQATPVVVSTPVVATQTYVVAAPAHNANVRRCRGCGRQFELEPGMNPASASAYRCKRCRGLQSISFF